MESDRNLIFDVINESERGFLTINKQVKDGLKSWYVSQLESLIKEDLENHELLMQGAAVMESFGFVAKAFFAPSKFSLYQTGNIRRTQPCYRCFRQ